jgi:phosphate/sulfate permease
MSTRRAIGFWVAGAVCLFFGVLIASSVSPAELIASGTPTASLFTQILAYVIAFVLILVGGMLWITSATLSAATE